MAGFSASGAHVPEMCSVWSAKPTIFDSACPESQQAPGNSARSH